MSTRAYNELWLTAQQDLEEVLEKETPQTKSEKARRNLKNLSRIYVQYISIMRKLDLCYDQMVHPQKRFVVRKLLDGTMARIVELKHEIVALELCEFMNFDEILTEMHLTHEDISVPIPRYFLQDRKEELQRRTESMDEILERFGLAEEKSTGQELTQDEAVRMIQTMERARQGRLRARQMQDMHARKQRERTSGVGGASATKGGKMSPAEERDTVQSHTAALKIQKVWKGYHTWKKIQQEREKEMLFLGMVPQPVCKGSAKSPYGKVEKIEELRRKIQKENELEYRNALERIKAEVLHTEGVDIMENMQVEIRNWFFTHKDKAGKFPDYPSDDEGGYQAALLQGGEEAQEVNKTKKNPKKKKNRKDEPSRSAGPGKQQSENSAGLRTKPSVILGDIVAANDEYNVWRPKLLKTSGINDGYDETIIRDEKRHEVTEELRTQVDALMRQELERLKMAVLRDKGKKGKKLLAAMKKKKKKKKSKPQKKKKERDLTPNRTVEFLYEELVREGVIRKHPEVQLNDFIGEPKYVESQVEGKTPTSTSPSLALADVRRLVTEYCILPLGSRTVHSQCPLVKSVLLVGPSGSGKTMLANAICTEARATLFDLSGRNLLGKYPGNEGLKMLLHLVGKVGRLLQPSVILLEDADRMFMKNVPKIEKADPKRIKKGLLKLMKGIEAEDRILVLGTSRSPFESDMKGLGSTYNKIILIPKPDHASRYVLWQQLIQKKGGKISNVVDLSLLTKISDGYTSGNISHAISQVLTPHRVALQSRQALRAQEFIGPLAKYEPVYKEEEDAFRAWYKRTPLAKKKMAALEPEDVKKAREKDKLKKKGEGGGAAGKTKKGK